MPERWVVNVIPSARSVVYELSTAGLYLAPTLVADALALAGEAP